MNYFQAIILSIVEGITEFLPISSTGHLILVSHLLNVPQTDFTKSFEIFIQLGAILAVAVLYFRTLWQRKELWPKIIIAFLPTAIIGLVLYKVVKDVLLGNEMVTVLALLLGGIFLIGIEYLHKEKDGSLEDAAKLSNKNAAIIGLYQSVSIIPGVSRSAATIVGGLLLGMKRTSAVEFSFFLAIPTMLAATGLDLVKSHFSFTGNEVGLLAVGFIVSFVVAMLAVKFFISYIKKHSFVPFGIYRIIIAIVYFLFVIR